MGQSSIYFSEAAINEMNIMVLVKLEMANGSRYYRALENFRVHVKLSLSYRSIASALSSALTVYRCQIRVHQTLTVYKLPTSYSSEEGVVAGHSGQFTPGGYPSAGIHTTLVGIEPTKTYNLPIVVGQARCAVGLPRKNNHHNSHTDFYRAMHFSAKRGIAIACRLSVRPSVCLSVCLSVTLVDCDHIPVDWNSSKIIHR